MKGQGTEITSTVMSPSDIRTLIPTSMGLQSFVDRTRSKTSEILRGKDNRLLMIVGPCSIHDTAEALCYAEKLAQLAKMYVSKVLLLMRAYIEKPRTSTGWKGFVNDPDLDGTHDINKGLIESRELFRQINEIGIGVATEVLNPMFVPYLEDLVSWSCIGARTSESQTHRELASGLESVIGVKNNTEGNVDAALNAIQAIAEPHTTLGVSPDGVIGIRSTRGNRRSHLVLRGGLNGPNYESSSVSLAVQKLKDRNLPTPIVVDCSHANAYKDHLRQVAVLEDVLRQRQNGSRILKGVMLESYLEAGKQPLKHRSRLKQGLSITDPCIDFKTTERLIQKVANRSSYRSRIDTDYDLQATAKV